MPEIPGETAGRHFNRRLVLAVALASFGSMTYGYSAGVTGTTLGQPSFTVYMGLDTAPNANALIGAMNALFYTGGFFGILLNSWLADKVGRKKSLAAGCFAGTGGCCPTRWICAHWNVHRLPFR